ncbi:MAG: ABC transporter ATP-binding protein [bacterium]
MISETLRDHINFLIKYLRPQWQRAALLAVVLLASIGLQLLGPQILARFIDMARAGVAIPELMQLAAVFLAVACAGQIISTIAAYASENVGWTATNLVRADLALHCLGLDLSFHNEKTPGEMIERVDGDVTHLSRFFSQFALRVFGNLLLLLGVLVMIFRVDRRVGLAYVGFSLFALFALRNLLELAVPYWKQARQASAILTGFLEERLAGTEDIRSSGATPYVMRRFFQAVRDQMEKTRRAGVMGTSMWAMTAALLTLGNAMAFGLGLTLYSAGLITFGTVYLLFHYTEMLRWPLEQITREVQELQRAAASVGRVGDLFKIRSKTVDGSGALPRGPLAVEFGAVSFAYEEQLVLRDVTFRLGPGQVLGLLGRTGSGKTTIGRLLIRMYDPSTGMVSLGGADIRGLRLHYLRRRVGMVTQDVQLFHASVRDNLTFFDRTIPDEMILEVLHRLGLDHWYRGLPHGLDTTLSSRGGLSAGEAQLLAFARVFFKDPGLVVLDEASSRLDPATEALIEHAVSVLLEQRTAIIIAHRLTTVRRADQIIIVDDGRVQEHGARVALERDPSSRFAGLLRTGLEEVLV